MALKYTITKKQGHIVETGVRHWAILEVENEDGSKETYASIASPMETMVDDWIDEQKLLFPSAKVVDDNKDL